MHYIAPKKIKKGSRVAIVAPSSAVHTDRLNVGLDIMKEHGLIPVLGPCVKRLKIDGMHAAPLEDRVDELNWAFSSPEISAVFCAIGGIGSSAVLPYLDYDAIYRSRKPLIGRSDISAINCGILKHAGLISINGQTPSIRLDKGEKYLTGQTDSLVRTLKLLMSSKPWGISPIEHNEYIPRTVSSGIAGGHVIGCTADTISRLIGTPHEPDFSDAILFLEDVHESPQSLARIFLHMKLAGVFDRIAGVVIGEFQEIRDADEHDMEEVVKEYFSDGPPCVLGYSFSHGSIVSPIPVGAYCTLNADTGDISFDFSMG